MGETRLDLSRARRALRGLDAQEIRWVLVRAQELDRLEFRRVGQIVEVAQATPWWRFLRKSRAIQRALDEIAAIPSFEDRVEEARTELDVYGREICLGDNVD